jgi:hypothetical protein
MDAQIEDGYLVFETGHFSDYVVAKLAATPASNGGGSSKTGDDTSVAFLAAIVLVALALLAGSVWGYIRLNGRHRRIQEIRAKS